MHPSIRHIALSLAAATAGAGLLCAGFVLLSRAGWIALAGHLGPVWASVILGMVFALAGLALAWVGLGRRRRPAPLRDPVVDLVTAFLQGAAAGRASRRR